MDDTRPTMSMILLVLSVWVRSSNNVILPLQYDTCLLIFSVIKKSLVNHLRNFLFVSFTFSRPFAFNLDVPKVKTGKNNIPQLVGFCRENGGRSYEYGEGDLILL